MVDENYREGYVQKKVDDKNAHFNRIGFNIGDLVIIEKSFDNNPQTRKQKMSEFYEEDIWRVIERVGANSFKLSSVQRPEETQTIVKRKRTSRQNI